MVRAPEVRLIVSDGKLLGNYSSFEALRMAQDQGLDLIEIAPNSSPPTCKIMDYGKYKYENKKKAQAAKKKQTVIVVKEIQVRPRTDQHDLDVKMRHARRFLLEGDKVKLNVRFVGREASYQEQGRDLLNRLSDTLKDLCILETMPKMEGRQMFVLLAPDPVKVKEFKKNMGKGQGPAVSSLEEAQQHHDKEENATAESETSENSDTAG